MSDICVVCSVDYALDLIHKLPQAEPGFIWCVSAAFAGDKDSIMHSFKHIYQEPYTL